MQYTDSEWGIQEEKREAYVPEKIRAHRRRT
ncbi:hypothetical protein CL3_17170 [butyrate-producing bacterium SM4/1]|nr:hypothetical protein CLS_08440 [[Clostridium] cf. saccharolyticum K10]CBL36244.1 hypothetical protein CL3_17170 [butyrate-producing bacterium SM4/1]